MRISISDNFWSAFCIFMHITGKQEGPEGPGTLT